MPIWRLPFWFVTFRDSCSSSKPSFWDPVCCLSRWFSWTNASFVLGTATHEHPLGSAVEGWTSSIQLYLSAVFPKRFVFAGVSRERNGSAGTWLLVETQGAFRDTSTFRVEPHLCCKGNQVQRRRYWFKPVWHWRVELRAEKNNQLWGFSWYRLSSGRTSCCNGIRSISVEPHDAQLWSGSRR